MSRTRYLYTLGGQPLPEPIEVTADFQASRERSGDLLMIDRFMEGERAPDGTDIGNRQKRRDWMRATGSADYSDFSGGHWERARAARAAPPVGVREAVVTAYKKLKGY